MKNWTDHGEIFNANQTILAKKNTCALCALSSDGEIYQYFGYVNRSIGVAVGNQQTGPFVDVWSVP